MKQLAAKMRGLDMAMLSTHSSHGHIASRPMSNNGEVDYDGTSHYFTWADSRMAKDIEKDAKVAIDFQSGEGGSFLFVNVQGMARVLTDTRVMAEHWHDELDRWFEDGLETEGLAMIVVDARRITYWSPDGDGEITLG